VPHLHAMLVFSFHFSDAI